MIGSTDNYDLNNALKIVNTLISHDKKEVLASSLGNLYVLIRDRSIRELIVNELNEIVDRMEKENPKASVEKKPESDVDETVEHLEDLTASQHIVDHYEAAKLINDLPKGQADDVVSKMSSELIENETKTKETGSSGFGRKLKETASPYAAKDRRLEELRAYDALVYDTEMKREKRGRGYDPTKGAKNILPEKRVTQKEPEIIPEKKKDMPAVNVDAEAAKNRENLIKEYENLSGVKGGAENLDNTKLIEEVVRRRNRS